MELTVQNVYGLLLRSKLLPLDQAKTMYDRWNADARDAAGNLQAFTRWVVAHRYLTDYQASLLARGHADGFFLNQYKILDRLGKGRMAGVYKAVHELGQVVAIKVLPPSKARDPQFLARFQREARLAFKLKHPNIVRAFQVGMAAGLHYFVMEYLEGETLDEVLRRRGKLPPPEAVRLIHQAMSGLQHIHAQGLVHRDLKPANLMLVPAPPQGANETTQRCTVKILDIGLGRAMFEDSPSEAAKKSNPGLTSEGVLLGTPDYMAPEQARDARSSDIRADIYSLGCVLYHTLAGQPPFPDTNIINQMIRHATEAPRPLKDFNPAVPDGLQQIVNWMLAKDPKQRYPTPERAAQALQVFLVAGAEVPTSLEADPKMKPFLNWVEAENSKAELALPRTGGAPRPTHPRPAAVPVPKPALPVATPVKPPAATSPAAPAAPRPAAPAAPPATGVAPTNPAAVQKEKTRHKSSGKSGKRRSKKHKRRPGGNPVAIPLKPGETGKAPVLEFDVELVPVPAPGSERPRPSAWQLTLRDCVLFGAGVGGTLLAIFAALMLSMAFPRKNHEATPPETPMTQPE
jgi:serine/threonine protein kinase